MPAKSGEPRVLIIEDTLSMALTYQRHLERAGIRVDITQTGVNAIGMLSSGEFSAALLDLQLPDMNGLEIIKNVRGKKIPVTFIVITANGSINTAVEAMKKGAYDFLIKPVAAQRLVTSVQNGIDRNKLEQTVEVLKKDLKPKKLNGFIGSSPAMLTVYRMIENISQSKAPVFITGESGTGKEVCAQAIHNSGPRAKRPFVPLNCAAIPENLMESEVFGHIKGAFTGASEARNGAASQAHGGTLFLDEICEMDINLQAKLLRFLQTGKVKRVGSDQLQDVDVRVICATNRDPMTEVQNNRFREDLFYRLDVLSIDLPPLRARHDDILELSEVFMRKYAKEESKDFKLITDEAKVLLKRHRWPGNIREIQNLMRKIVVMYSGPEVTAEMITQTLKTRLPGQQPYKLVGLVGNSSNTELKRPFTLDIERSMPEIERDIIEAVIAAHDDSVPLASKVLGLSPSTIYRKRESWLTENADKIEKSA